MKKEKKISDSNTLACEQPTNSPSVSGSFGDIHLREFRILIQLTPARVRTEGLKLSVKVVHVVCDCRLDSS